MIDFTRSLSTLALLALAGSALAAQQPAATREGTLKTRLRNLVVAQEQYFMGHGTYTTDVAALKMFSPEQRPADSVWVQVVNAGGRSWWGRAVHMGDRSKSCVIYVGYATDLGSAPVTERDSTRAVNEGEPACDRF